MDATQWEASTELEPLLDFLKANASDRKLRLFACACCRRIWHLLPDERSRTAVAVAEKYADELASDEERHAAWCALQVVFVQEFSSCQDLALRAVTATVAAGSMERSVGTVARDARNAVAHHAVPEQLAESAVAFNAIPEEASENAVSKATRSPIRRAEEAVQVDLFRDLFGNPLRPSVINPVWLTWNRCAIPSLAQRIYNDADFAALPSLAVALRQAGCTDNIILDHCRYSAHHARGCWVLDLLLKRS